jgi:hypothetical protein
MLNVQNKKVVDVSDWDRLVEQVYGRPYNFQQQDGCKSRGTHNLGVPTGYTRIDDNINEDGYDEEGYDNPSLKFWLSKDPKEYPAHEDKRWREMYWERDFYPDIDEIAEDLYRRGLLEAGEYLIDIDW